VISQVKADLMGKISNCSGTMDLAIDWRFHSSHNDSLLFSTVTNTRYMVSAARGHEVLNDAVTHAARVLLEDETLNERLAGVRSAGMAMAKGGQIQLKKPLPVQFAGRKDMMSALVKAVVTIQTEKGHGSGFVITNDGHVITNEHVVGRDGQVKVKFEQGFTLTGEVLKTNKDHDLALIKVDAADLPALAIGNDAELMLGEEIFAIGTPLDAALGQSVSRGILSGRRDLDGLQFLQTDVSINPGNSGGPLIDENGTVVGVATMKISGQGMEGLGFGVPISRALEMLNITMK
jgi:S1-C subfamily serine protease